MTRITTEYLDGQYYAKNPSFHVEDSPWKAAQILTMLEHVRSNPCTIAEVGCGAGEILVRLSHALPHATFFGYELSPQGYQLCRARETRAIKYYHRDIAADQLELPYDLVLCIDVFEHIEDPFTFLRGIRECGRSFIFHIPLDMNAQMVARNVPMTVRMTVGHLHYFCKDTALATLQECGYEVKAWSYTAAGVDRTTTKGKLLRLPRRVCFKLMPDLTARVLGGFSLMVYAVAKASECPAA